MSNISVTHNGTSLSVSWDAPAGATHYDVTYYGNGVNARAAWNRAGTTLEITCDIRPDYQNQHCVSSEHSYTVGVRARNAAGESDWRNSDSASLPAPGGASAGSGIGRSASLMLTCGPRPRGRAPTELHGRWILESAAHIMRGF